MWEKSFSGRRLNTAKERTMAADCQQSREYLRQLVEVFPSAYLGSIYKSLQKDSFYAHIA